MARKSFAGLFGLLLVCAFPARAESLLEGWYELRPTPGGRAPFAVQGWAVADCGGAAESADRADSAQSAMSTAPEVVLFVDEIELWRGPPHFAWPGVAEKFPTVKGAARAGFWAEIDPARLAAGEHRLGVALQACGQELVLGHESFHAAPPTPVLVAVPVLLGLLGVLAALGWGLSRRPEGTWQIPRLPARLAVLLALVLVTVIAARHVGGSVIEIEDGLFAPLANWDGGYYLALAESGYDREESAFYAFFPLYPALLALLAFLPGPTPLWGALTNATFFLAAITLLRRLYPDHDNALLFFAVLPFAFFQVVLYTEALALLLSVAFLHELRRGHSGRALLCGALAGLTRISAVALVFFAVEPLVRGDRRGFAAALSPLVGLAGWMLYLSLTVGDPLAFLHVQAEFGRDVAFHPGRLLDLLLTAPGRGAFTWWELTFLALVLVGAAGLAARRRFGEAFYSVAIVAMALFTLRLTSLNRYALGAFPVFLFLGKHLGAALGRRGFQVLIGIEILLLFFFAARFGQQAWVG